MNKNMSSKIVKVFYNININVIFKWSKIRLKEFIYKIYIKL